MTNETSLQARIWSKYRGREGRKDKSERKKSKKGESEDGVEEGQR